MSKTPYVTNIVKRILSISFLQHRKKIDINAIENVVTAIKSKALSLGPYNERNNSINIKNLFMMI